MRVPSQAEIEDKLRGEDLDLWLELWRTEQGAAKPAALKLIAAAIPFPIDQSLRVLTWDAEQAMRAAPYIRAFRMRGSISWTETSSSPLCAGLSTASKV